MILLGTISNYVGKLYLELICFRFVYQTWFVITFIRTLMIKSICELYVTCDMYVESYMILVVVNHLSIPVVVLDGLPGLYGFKYNSATACGLPLYLYSYKLVGSATPSTPTDMPTTTQEKEPNAASTLGVVDATTAARTGARAPACRALRPSAGTSSTLLSR